MALTFPSDHQARHCVSPRRAITMLGTTARADSRVSATTISAMSPASIMSAGSIRSRTHELISVSTYPGEMAVAATPDADSSVLTDWHSETSAALVAAYAARPGSGASAVSEAIATIRAPH